MEESMRTSLTRAVAGAAIAATAVLTAVGTAGAAGATVKPPTTLSVVESKAIIKLGQKDLLTGTLTVGKTPLADQNVALERLVAGTWHILDVRKTGTFGHVFFTVQPAVTAKYELQFFATTKYQGTHSNPVTVVVVQPKPKLTILTIGQTKTKIKPGQSDTIFGTLSAAKTPLPGELVWLYQIVNGKLVNGNGHFTSKLGGVSFTVKPGATAHYELKFYGTPKYAGTHSGVVTVVVS
jgi:hypothetical protein